MFDHKKVVADRRVAGMVVVGQGTVDHYVAVHATAGHSIGDW